jgi:predicted transcriptional regulator
MRTTKSRGITELENEVMQAVWSLGPSSVEAVHEVVSRTRDVKEATTRTILRRLEQKGYLKHEEQGRTYIYRPVESARGVAARAVRQMIDKFCRGSLEELVSGMIETKVLSKRELKALEEFIRKQTTGGR